MSPTRLQICMGAGIAMLSLPACSKSADPRAATTEPAEPAHAYVDAAPAPKKAAPPVKPPEVPPDMVLVPGGTFKMGPPEDLSGGAPPVTTSVGAFFIDRTEVTTDAYLACVRAARCELPPRASGCNATEKKPRLTHPVNCVTKPQADRYCTEQGKRLPSESEWEFAARGSDGRAYPWGNDPPAEQLCWQNAAKAGNRRTCPVASYPQGASPFGALDMAGNVAEWTATENKEASGPGAFYTHGGGYLVDEMASPDYYDVRADKRDSRGDTRVDPDLGFRCAKSI